MREIVFDTETTGFKPDEGHRIVEIGMVELVNRMPTGKHYHVYLNPERDMPKEAEAVHGLSSAFLKDKPLFASQAEALMEFIGDAVLIAHNATFDMTFINAELGYTDRLSIPPDRVIDTLLLARRSHPMGPNSLDALCKRYGVDNSRRTKHGALLDAELLADVYLEMTGGKQTSLGLAAAPKSTKLYVVGSVGAPSQRLRPLSARLTDDERGAHAEAVEALGPDALWNQ
ncbi:DNA polymerase III subunit epsilon [Aestuariivirga litoralis]|uniref:DNA polymerase III subunit epsilon n=1 Tax=Aestuariivirga litoralis TaxID=2650924 RepID=UPI0018C59847|nr:DNA polymerase III subunit epsilon [Aestuariivirga litoralis]MBG1233778.1 DNA polymerase III subunit epsilon [Aestuariivirga litoralis]